MKDLVQVLPPATLAAWRILASLLPVPAYLVRGTGLAVRLGHRESEDLDFFLSGPTNFEDLASLLNSNGLLKVISMERGTLNAYFNEVKVQFLDASPQIIVAPHEVIEGIPVGSLADLMATKLQVLPRRTEIRDYVDLWAIEKFTGLRVEEGIGIMEQRYPGAINSGLRHQVILALGSFADVRGSALPKMLKGFKVTPTQLEKYWLKRLREITRTLSPSVLYEAEID